MKQKEGKPIKDALSETPQALLVLEGPSEEYYEMCPSLVFEKGRGLPHIPPSCTCPGAKQFLHCVRNQEAGRERSLEQKGSVVVQMPH